MYLRRKAIILVVRARRKSSKVKVQKNREKNKI